MRFLAHGSHWSHGFCLRHFEHEIFLHEIFLNTNNPNNTNIFWHTDLTHGFFALDVWTRILRITRILFGTRISFFLYTDLTDLTDFEPSARCEWQLVGLLTRCGYWLVVVIDSLWLLTHCGYWLVVVIGLLCFKWQIKKDVREPCEALADPWDLWDPCA